MIINKESWHYRVGRFGHSNCLVDAIRDGTVNSCKYRNIVMVGMLKFTLAVSMMVFMAGACLATFINMLAAPIALLAGWEHPILEHAVPISVISWACGIIILVHRGYSKLNERRLNNKLINPTPEQPPSIVKQWIKSYKDKYCPLVTFE